MFAGLWTFLISMMASFHRRGRLCLRGFTRILLVLMIFSFVGVYTHFATTPHVHSAITGMVIHLDPNASYGEHHHLGDSWDGEIPVPDDDECPIVETIAHVMSFSLSSRTGVLSADDLTLISKEVQFRQLEIVYFSHRALEQAPKHSPPQITG